MPAWARQLERRLLAGRPAPADRFWADPARLLSDAGYEPDPWQAEALRAGDPRVLLCCSRQSGKTTVAAALALRAALLEPESLVLVLSPTLRQSGEILRDKVLRLYNRLGRPVPAAQESALQLTLANGSRVISLPGEEGTVRGYSSVRLLVIDEAARVSDELYRGVRPMLAVSGGRLLALSGAWARQGWYYEEWAGSAPWRRVKVTARDCPRIDPAFLAEERAALGPVWFAMEYECEFTAGVAGLFRPEDIQAMFDNDLQPLFGAEP